MITTYHATIMPLWYMFSLLSHAFNFHVSHLYVPLSSLRLTWLTNPAPVTSVYPNWMQYTPRVLQEVSLLDGVDASVRGNGRRFSKTSRNPPCRRYAFILFYPYFLTTSSSLCPGWFIHSHDLLNPAVTLQINPTLLIAFVPLLIPSSYYIWEPFLVMAEQCS